MRGRNPFIVFDWHFTDASDESARSAALQDRPKETKVLMDLSTANTLIHFALWEQLPKGHPVAQLWLETETDLEASIYLAYGGFFRQALSVLRTWFELVVHGVYFSDHFGQPTGRYEQWRKGLRNAPAKMKPIAESLAARTDKKLEVSAEEIFNLLNPTYDFLSHQAHGSGLDVYDLQDGRDNVPRYLERSFTLWYEAVIRAFDAACFLYRVFFPSEVAGYLTDAPTEMRRALKVARLLSDKAPNLELLITEGPAG